MNVPTSSPPYTAEQLTLLRDLYAAGCVLVGDEVERRFGLRSPIYINMRENLYAQPELLWRVGGEFAWKIVELASGARDSAANSAARVSKRANGNIMRDDASAITPTALPQSADAILPTAAVPQARATAETTRDTIHDTRDTSRILAPQTVVGIPDTATPLAMTTALYSWGNRTNPRITFALLRKEAKRYPGHEPHYWLGPQDSGDASGAPREYNLIDDVVASGLTKRTAAERMRAEGIPLTRIIVLFDRGQGDGLREEGFALHSIFNLREVVNYYAAEGLITPTDHTRITEFLQTRRFDRSGYL